jgi:hypothetical protein
VIIALLIAALSTGSAAVATATGLASMFAGNL